VKTGQLGRYEIVRHLANGGMAQVLLAKATGIEGFSRHVVVKRIHQTRTSDPVFVKMFLDEARLAARLHHHNIVQVHDIGQEGGEYFFAMEYIHGEDLRSLLMEVSRRRAQVPLEHVVSIVTAVAAALHYAHELRGPDRKPLGLVHRDVSPGNILVGFDGNVKVVDFGIAKAAALRDTNTTGGMLKGKVAYMAPEQCAGEPSDRRSDVYALGVVLFELVTVRRLFKSTNDYLTMSAIVAGEVPFPSKYRPGVPPALEDIIFKALSVAPDRRYTSADELRRALDQFASQHGLRTSVTALADYMKSLFGERPEPWLTDEHAPPLELSIDFDGSASGAAVTPPDEPSRAPSGSTEPPPIAAPLPAPRASPPPTAMPPIATPRTATSESARVAIPPKRAAAQIPNATPPVGVASTPARPAVARTVPVSASTLGPGRPAARATLASGVVMIPERSKAPSNAPVDARARSESAPTFASRPTTEMDPLRVNTDDRQRLGASEPTPAPPQRPPPPPVPAQARRTDANDASTPASAPAAASASTVTESPPNKWPKGTEASVAAAATHDAANDARGPSSDAALSSELAPGDAGDTASAASAERVACAQTPDAARPARRRRASLIAGGLVAALAAVLIVRALGGDSASDSGGAPTKNIEHASTASPDLGSAEATTTEPATTEQVTTADAQTGSAAISDEAKNAELSAGSATASSAPTPTTTSNGASKHHGATKHGTRSKPTPASSSTKSPPNGSWNPDQLFPD
jgi:serine/threonine protein kinase